MKFSSLLPSFLRQTDPTINPPVGGLILPDLAPPPKPASPFDAMEAHLASLIATQTAAQAEHQKAVEAVNDYIDQLKNLAETHQKSIAALYTAVPQVNTGKPPNE